MRFSRLFLTIAVLGAVVAALYFFRSGRPDTAVPSTELAQNGGRIVASYRTEPRSFNRLVAPQAAEDLLTRLTQATLVRVDRKTGRVEPRLAREWTVSPDGLTWTFSLRDGVTFSDGEPFTSADVVFSFRALYDPNVKSEIAASLLIDGRPMSARAVDAHTVIVTFPAPYGPGIGLLDALPILPEHKLGAALAAGTFREAWNVTTPVGELAGLGPFILQEFTPGQRMVFGRNPRFWLRDEHGLPLPHIDTLEIQFTPDQNAEVLRLQAGDSDLMTDRVRFEDLTALRRLERDGRITIHDAGVSIAPDMLWFNLDPDAAVARDRPWLQREELRRAISAAVDRTAVVNTVFLGEAVEVAGPITPGHGEWFLADLPRPSFDPDDARALLKSIGLSDRNGDGWLDDDRGRTASFSILTQKGHTVRERTAAIIQEQLKRIGLKVDVAPMEARAMIGQWSVGDYDAIFFAIEFDSFDPARHLDFWLSSGPFHFWHPGQPSPATTWEAQIDDLMTRQSTTVDQAARIALFADVQRVFAEHVPVLYFAAPKVEVASSARVRGVTASVLAPSVLWNAERLYVTGESSGRRP